MLACSFSPGGVHFRHQSLYIGCAIFLHVFLVFRFLERHRLRLCMPDIYLQDEKITCIVFVLNPRDKRAKAATTTARAKAAKIGTAAAALAQQRQHNSRSTTATAQQ